MPLSIMFSDGDGDKKGMESPGACIRRERELRDFSIQNVHEATRIPVKILVALEADDFESLPQPAFVKGYIKACCKFMGLDETDLLLRYELYLKENAPQKEEPRAESVALPAPERSVALDPKKIVGLLLVVGVIIIIGFYFIHNRGREETITPSPQEAAEGAPETMAAPKKEASPAPSRARAVAPLHPLADKAAPAEAPGHVLKVIASDKVWIKFTIDGKKTFEVLFKKGEDRHWLMKKGVSLVIGNAAGATLVFDGKPVSIAHEQGRVVRLTLPREEAAPAGINKGKALEERPRAPMEGPPRP